MAILYNKNTLYICKHEEVLIEKQQILKHTLHTSHFTIFRNGFTFTFQGPFRGSFFCLKLFLSRNRNFYKFPVLRFCESYGFNLRSLLFEIIFLVFKQKFHKFFAIHIDTPVLHKLLPIYIKTYLDKYLHNINKLLHL